MKRDKDIKYLLWNNQRGVNWIHGRGYHWFKNRFLPAINKAQYAANSDEDFEILSDAYYNIGDIYDYNEAPKAAIEAYKKSINFDPDHAEAYREIGCRYIEIGQPLKAKKYIEKAIELSPEDEYATSDLEEIQNGESSPSYREDDIYLEVRELIAQMNFKKVFHLLENDLSVQAAQYRACAYAAFGMKDKVIAEWQKISNSQEPIIMNYIDWFHIQKIIWNLSFFWEILLNCIPRFQHGVWEIHHSLREAIKTASSNDNADTDILFLHERLKLYITFQIARSKRDIITIQSLSKQYPQWEEVNQLLEKWL